MDYPKTEREFLERAAIAVGCSSCSLKTIERLRVLLEGAMIHTPRKAAEGVMTNDAKSLPVGL